jgi:hypothetical protein
VRLSQSGHDRARRASSGRADRSTGTSTEDAPSERPDSRAAEDLARGLFPLTRYSPFPLDSPATYCLRGADGVG